MDDQIDITPLLDTGYVQQQVSEGNNAVFKNGRLVYIILDVNKAGKYFYDLRSVFNASTGEGGKTLKIMFMNNAIPYQLNGKTVSITGKYPSGTFFNATGTECQANSSLIDFQFPLGLFQEAGIYQFQFEIKDESGNLATSHYCFFQVTQNATTLALDWQNGVNPFDSDYAKWKNQVENRINDLNSQLSNAQTSMNNLGDQVTTFKGLLDNYTGNVNGIVNTAVNGRFNQANTWNATQTFNSGIDVSGDFTFKGQPMNWPDNFQSANVVGNNVDGTKIHYMATAQFLFIFGWIGSPKSTQSTFKAYIPTSITNRIVIPGDSNNSVYYVGVDDGDWIHPSGNTTPVELYLEVNNGELGINSAAGDGGCRINWIIPIYA